MGRETLLPCPFCGTHAEVVCASHIRCANIYNCDCETRLGERAWNRRVLSSQAGDNWKQAALRIGEMLADTGPNGYYDFDPATWAAWCDSQIRTMRKMPHTNTAAGSGGQHMIATDSQESPAAEHCQSAVPLNASTAKYVENAAPQVSPMVTRGDSGQNPDADSRKVEPATVDQQEVLNPAVAAPLMLPSVALSYCRDGELYVLEAAYREIRSVASQAIERMEKAESEVYYLTRAGIIEFAIRNPSVASYMEHWEKRAEAAEALVESVRRINTKLALENADLQQWKRDAADEIVKQVRSRVAAEAQVAALTRPSISAARVREIIRMHETKAWPFTFNLVKHILLESGVEVRDE